jgi:hypothetical protein
MFRPAHRSRGDALILKAREILVPIEATVVLALLIGVILGARSVGWPGDRQRVFKKKSKSEPFTQSGCAPGQQSSCEAFQRSARKR